MTAASGSGRPRRRAPLVLVWAALLAVAVALPFGDSRRIPVEVWFAGFAFWLTALVAADLLRAAPRSTISRPGLTVWLPETWRRSPEPSPPRPLDEQRFIQNLLERAVDSERAYDRRLRPRLRALADHHLTPSTPVGVDETGRAAADPSVVAALGDTAWLIADRDIDRRPTLDDIERFLDLVEAGALATETEAGR